jgi:hypothetical protein
VRPLSPSYGRAACAHLDLTGSAVKTPVLDDLAVNGVRLLSYYVQRACSPTRAAIQTGRYNIRYRMQSGVLEPGQRFGLALDETLLPEALGLASPEPTPTPAISRFPNGHTSAGDAAGRVPDSHTPPVTTSPPAPTDPDQNKCPPSPSVVPGSWAAHAIGKWHVRRSLPLTYNLDDTTSTVLDSLRPCKDARVHDCM